MDEKRSREEFDTGLKKIRLEIKSLLVPHGLYGRITDVDTGPSDAPAGSKIEIIANGRTAGRSFDRQQIEDCHLRVGGQVLVDIVSMVDELAA